MRRPVLLVVWVLELWLAVVLALAALAWIWSGSAGSLAQALPPSLAQLTASLTAPAPVGPSSLHSAGFNWARANPNGIP